jgi:hypothetical protein
VGCAGQDKGGQCQSTASLLHRHSAHGRHSPQTKNHPAQELHHSRLQKEPGAHVSWEKQTDLELPSIQWSGVSKVRNSVSFAPCACQHVCYVIVRVRAYSTRTYTTNPYFESIVNQCVCVYVCVCVYANVRVCVCMCHVCSGARSAWQWSMCTLP